MAGSVRKSDMYVRFRLLRFIPDFTSLKLWFFEVPDRRNDTILRATADHMARKGIALTDCLQYCPEHVPQAGVLTRRAPSAAQQKDIAFGWRIAKEVGRLDIGQSIAVKEQEVIAVEAIEGTDRMTNPKTPKPQNPKTPLPSNMLCFILIDYKVLLLRIIILISSSVHTTFFLYALQSLTLSFLFLLMPKNI